MVEQGTHKPLVGGSNPPSATNSRSLTRELGMTHTTASRSRAEAAEAIIAMDLPFGDWEQMKAEIIAGASEGGA